METLSDCVASRVSGGSPLESFARIVPGTATHRCPTMSSYPHHRFLVPSPARTGLTRAQDLGERGVVEECGDLTAGDLRDQMGPHPVLQTHDAEIIARKSQFHVVVDPLDDAERDLGGMRLLCHATVEVPDPRSQATTDPVRQGTAPHDDGADPRWRPSLVGELEVEVVDLPRHPTVDVDDLSVQQLETGLHDIPGWSIVVQPQFPLSRREHASKSHDLLLDGPDLVPVHRDDPCVHEDGSPTWNSSIPGPFESETAGRDRARTAYFSPSRNMPTSTAPKRPVLLAVIRRAAKVRRRSSAPKFIVPAVILGGTRSIGSTRSVPATSARTYSSRLIKTYISPTILGGMHAHGTAHSLRDRQEDRRGRWRDGRVLRARPYVDPGAVAHRRADGLGDRRVRDLLDRLAQGAWLDARRARCRGAIRARRNHRRGSAAHPKRPGRPSMIAHGYWGGPGWGIVGGLVSIAFLVLVVAFVAALMSNRSGAGPTAASSAIRILEARYARGDISRDEFLERRAALTGSAKAPPPPPQ